MTSPEIIPSPRRNGYPRLHSTIGKQYVAHCAIHGDLSLEGDHGALQLLPFSYSAICPKCLCAWLVEQFPVTIKERE